MPMIQNGFGLLLIIVLAVMFVAFWMEYKNRRDSQK